MPCGSVGRRSVETSWQGVPRERINTMCVDGGQQRLRTAEERLAPVAFVARAEVARHRSMRHTTRASTTLNRTTNDDFARSLHKIRHDANAILSLTVVLSQSSSTPPTHCTGLTLCASFSSTVLSKIAQSGSNVVLYTHSMYTPGDLTTFRISRTFFSFAARLQHLHSPALLARCSNFQHCAIHTSHSKANQRHIDAGFDHTSYSMRPTIVDGNLASLFPLSTKRKGHTPAVN